MARILVLSSQVARGAVGLSIIGPALSRLGHEVIGLPTVLLSNHPGHPHSAGMNVPPEVLADMLGALAGNGWLGRLDAVLTGYLPSAAHVALASAALDRVAEASPRALYLCDPVLGDDPKGLYIEADAAAAIRDTLLPRAGLATPNRYELAWLTGRTVDSIADAARALECLPCGGGIATSIPARNPDHGRTPADLGDIANVAALADALAAARVPRRAYAPHGSGDLFSALVLHGLLQRQTPEATLAAATAGIEAALVASGRADALMLPPDLGQAPAAADGRTGPAAAGPITIWSRRR